MNKEQKYVNPRRCDYCIQTRYVPSLIVHQQGPHSSWPCQGTERVGEDIPLRAYVPIDVCLFTPILHGKKPSQRNTTVNRVHDDIPDVPGHFTFVEVTRHFLIYPPPEKEK